MVNGSEEEPLGPGSGSFCRLGGARQDGFSGVPYTVNEPLLFSLHPQEGGYIQYTSFIQ